MTHNGFTLGLSDDFQAAWAEVFRQGNASAASSLQAEERRGTPTDFSTFHGMSRKSSPKVPIRMEAKNFVSKAELLRRALADGPMDARALSAVIERSVPHTRALLQYDCEMGRVMRVPDTQPRLYALAEARA